MISDKKLHIELHYLTPIEVIAMAQQCGTLLLEAHENYQKGSFRNKAHILSPNEYQLLTIPLKSGKNSRTHIQKVEIAYDEDWIDLHLKAIDTAYGTAPYFDYYFEELQALLNKKHRYLWNLNLEILEWMHRRLGLSFQIEITDSWYRKSPGIDIRSQLKAKANPEMKNGNLIEPYSQVFEYKYGFRPGPSALDFLMCVGPESSLYFKTQKTNNLAVF